MKPIRTFLLSTVVCAIVASPVLAMDLTADAMLGATPEDMTTIKMVEDSAFVGNEVRTMDQVVIGLVKGVSMNADGSNLVFIELSGDIAAKSSVKNFTVTVPQDMTADGSLTLGWNETDLFKALSSNLESTTSGG
jgi:hypothetical protein